MACEELPNAQQNSSRTTESGFRFVMERNGERLDGTGGDAAAWRMWNVAHLSMCVCVCVDWSASCVSYSMACTCVMSFLSSTIHCAACVL